MEQLQRATAQKVAREIDRLPDGVQQSFDRRVGRRDARLRDAERSMASACASTSRAREPRSPATSTRRGPSRSGGGDLRAARVGRGADSAEWRLPGSRRDLDSRGLAARPAAGRVRSCGGNVETSQRIVDVLLGALGKLAASQGTMNNVAFGDASFGYYETIGGGSGAGEGFDGASGVHTHMTNTRITDAEVLEARHPVRLLRFAMRRGSGGSGPLEGRGWTRTALRVLRAGDRLTAHRTPNVFALGARGRRTRRPWTQRRGAQRRPGRGNPRQGHDLDGDRRPAASRDPGRRRIRPSGIAIRAYWPCCPGRPYCLVRSRH